MRHALFLLEEEITFVVGLREAAQLELADLPRGQMLAHVWRLDAQIEELEEAHRILLVAGDPLAGRDLDAPVSLPLFPGLH